MTTQHSISSHLEALPGSSVVDACVKAARSLILTDNGVSITYVTQFLRCAMICDIHTSLRHELISFRHNNNFINN